MLYLYYFVYKPNICQYLFLKANTPLRMLAQFNSLKLLFSVVTQNTRLRLVTT